MQSEFEKQVQQKMDTLRLVPTDPVWQKVNDAIKRRRDKKRFFVFLLAGLMISAVGVWYLLPANKTAVLLNPTEKSKPVYSAPGISTTASSPVEPNKPSAVISRHKIVKSSLLHEQKINTGNPPVSVVNKKEILPDRINQELIQEKEVAQKQAVTPIRNSTVTPTQNNTGITSIDSSATVAKGDTVIATVEDKPVQVIPQDTMAKQPGKHATRKQWHKVIYLQAGSSSFRQGLLANNIVYSAPNSNMSNFPGRVYYRGQTTPGISYGLGAGVIKDFSNRWQLTLALRYQYYSTKSNVGNKYINDTTVRYGGTWIPVSEYYTNTGTQSYTNKVTMAAFSPAISYQLLRQVPLRLSIGAAYGLLVHSNTLSYDEITNLYYYNKKNIVKNYIQLTSGLSYEVGTTHKMFFGPVFQYTANEQQKANVYTFPHLYFIGLQAGIKF